MENNLRDVFNFIFRGIENDLRNQEFRLEQIEEQVEGPLAQAERQSVLHRRDFVRSHILAIKHLISVLILIKNFLLVLLPIFLESSNRLIGLFAEGSPLDHLIEGLEDLILRLQELHNLNS